VENEGVLDTRPAVFVSNHQSELDIVFLGRVFPKHCSVTAKRSLKYIPFLGWFSMRSFVFLFCFHPSLSRPEERVVGVEFRDEVWRGTDIVCSLVALSGTVFIDRTNRKSAIAAFDSAIQEIKGNKQSVWIFPVCCRTFAASH